jgi:N-acetyl sugar amidotransferase
MDSSDPEIVFDLDGVSNYWKENQQKLKTEVVGGPAGRAKAEQIAKDIRNESAGAEYDCLIGVSGGIDSSVVAYWVRKLGLNPLAIHMDNGWNSELAVSNIESIVTRLDIDLHTEVLDWPEFRDLQRSFFFASVPNCEIPTDHAIISTLFRLARKYNIRHIISGSNVVTEAINQRNAGHDNKDWSHIADIHRRFGTLRLKRYPRLSMLNFAKAILMDRVQFVPILNYLDYNWRDSKELLERELGWKPYPRKHGESLFTRFFQEYYLPTKFGIDKRRMHFSSLICAGQMTRDQALILLDQPLYSRRELEAEIEFVCDKLQFTKEEFEEIMSARPKSHLEYRTSPLFRNQSSRIYRWARRLATGRDT